MSMDEGTGTNDDETSTTHKSLSIGPNDHTHEAIDLSSDDDETSSQHALQHESSDDDLYPDTHTPIGLKTMPVEGNISHHDIVDQMNMDFSERVRSWTWHEN
ncbi:uncharacterized protein N7515_007094 [Penicillium bovifimosum]|uniref:Uncharacterized protein n=1 Tax=Penicillium bovifimosum TaxID=126998 RepID=A0A9W9GVY6_9EURO|nr:uncharacterized protein N7515_007094 [Penicillium bovifimosum]KAJ5131055.1 hypothetical protein N7515_007094 [Penicillium bovifimosum]